jgi:DNA-binding MurR/RpiR family transcriptional regulator
MKKATKKTAVQKWRSITQADRLAQLAPRRQEIIRPVFEDPRQFVLLSVRDLAGKLGTDPATTIRIVRGLGFESYKEFQHYLHELSVVRSTSLDNMQTASDADLNTNAHVHACIDQELKNIRAVYNGLDLARLEAAARRLWKARRLLVVGGDLASTLVEYLDYHLNMLGLPVYSATAPGQAVHAVRGLTEDDVVLAISFRRGLRMTVEALQHSRQTGAYCIGITNTYISPVARFADEFFLTPVDTKSFSASYTGCMFFLNVFLTTVAECERGKTLQMMKQAADEQLHGYRFYDE